MLDKCHLFCFFSFWIICTWFLGGAKVWIQICNFRKVFKIDYWSGCWQASCPRWQDSMCSFGCILCDFCKINICSNRLCVHPPICTLSACNNASRQTTSPSIKAWQPSSFSASSSILTRLGHPWGKIPLLETKWLTILKAEPFCHWTGQIAMENSTNRGGGILPLDGGSLPWITDSTSGGHFATGWV